MIHTHRARSSPIRATTPISHHNSATPPWSCILVLTISPLVLRKSAIIGASIRPRSYRSRGVRAVRPFLHRSRYLCAVLLSVLSTGAAAWRPPPGPAHREELSEHVEIAGPAQLNELVAAAATDSAA